jgi:hypothetical protein
VIGLAVTVFPAATAAFALGMVEEDQLSGRVARNETFTHGGNVVFAIAAGAIGTLLALQGTFYAAAVFAAGMAVPVYFIKDAHVNYEVARGGWREEGRPEACQFPGSFSGQAHPHLHGRCCAFLFREHGHAAAGG